MGQEQTVLRQLGYDDYFEFAKNDLGFATSQVARVTARHRDAYTLRNNSGEFYAHISGKMLHNALSTDNYPVVGDWVIITELPEHEAVINDILPRKTVLELPSAGRGRIIAANIDTAFIVGSVDRDFNINRLERYYILVSSANIKPVIILNKTDLVTQEELADKISRISDRIRNTDILSVNTVNDDGFHTLLDYIQPYMTYCFLGSSGVGKSTLINRLLGVDEIKTGTINEKIMRGRHTTTRREIHIIPIGGIVIDNPGLREISVVGTDSLSDEINVLSMLCKFTNCTHVNEPGCAVLPAVDEGRLDRDHYFNYLKMKKEKDFYDMTAYQKHVKDRKFGQMVKKIVSEQKVSDN